MKESLLILAAALAMVSCGGNAQQKAATAGTQQTTAAAPDMHNAETSLDYLGVYKGTLPAADCPGIETTLTLAPDGSYALHLKYIDRDSEFDEKGAFTVKENLLTLTPSEGGQPQYYKVEENRLRRLDAEKQPVTGALADNYTLQKTTEYMNKAKVYIKENKERSISELLDLLRIPSISAQSERKPDMQRCAEFLAAALVKAGADRADVLPTEGNPVVYAEKTVDPGAKTVLVYGHYDVMPVDPRDEWRTEPFEPVIRDGRIWGRGADDDKGQLWMHAKAFEAMCATDSLPCNVKFMLEGEEEIGSPSLYGFCEQNKELLKADIILVSDTSMISMQTPSITCGLRGLAYMEVEVTGPDKDLHSGLFGGAVANPANVLARLVAGLVDENGRVTIPGFYDDVRELTPAEREAFNKAPFSLEDYKKSLKIGDVEGEAGYTTLERTGVRPSLDVNGIWGGYTGEGTKTVIPSKASAKISMRLVPNQDYRKISELFEKHFRAIAPESVKVVVKSLHGGMPYVAPTDMPAYKAAEKAVEATFGKKPLPFYSGGSIPIISGFESILGIKSLLIGFGLAEDAIHSPNESYGLEQFDKGVETIPLFYKYFAESE